MAEAARHRAARRRGDDRDLRAEILTATRRLLDDHDFAELAVADILSAAGVSRGSFYFYFSDKYDVLAELVRQAVAAGHEAAEPFLADEGDRRAAVRHGIAEGARLWRAEAPVLRAIVENWRGTPQLTELWLDLMRGFTTATADRLAADPDTAPVPAALPATLTWLGERLYYLAAVDIPPFDDPDALIDVLTHIWMAVLYPTPPK